MAKTKIPNPLERRHLIERELPADQALAIADAYLAEERSEEAVAFLRKAGATERLEELLARAVDAGDVFLVRETTRALRRDLPPAEWEEVARRARDAGKELYAEAADRQASRSDD